MKAYELLNSPESWCQESPGQTAQGKKVCAFDSRAVKWCALGAIRKAYPQTQWKKRYGPSAAGAQRL